MLSKSKQLVVDLKTTLGPLYEITVGSDETIEINTPFLNQINDNYRMFVQKEKDNGNYVLDDDGDSLNEFTLHELSTKTAINYLQHQNVEVDEDNTLNLKTNEENLIDSILKMLNIQMDLTCILQLATLEQNHNQAAE